MKSKKVKEFRLGELFCGPGGLAYAAVACYTCKFVCKIHASLMFC